jgi:hypothetical protein
MLTGLFASLLGVGTASADDFASPYIKNYWARADLPVVTGSVNRGYVWGERPFYTTYEEYGESPNQRRLVQYFDKSRMEITRPAPDGDPRSPFFVTNGLLAKELILGSVQYGDNTYRSRYPAFDIPVAGDPGDVNPDAPTYASFFNLVAVLFPNVVNIGPSGATNCGPSGGQTGLACDSPIRTNEPVVDVLNKDGSISRSVGLGTVSGARYVYYDRTFKRNIPEVFWNYLNQTGIIFNGTTYTTGPVFDWIATFGYPLTDAYWVNTRVGGVLKSVMVQIFERRVLTFTPGNPPGFQVEMGNIGQHYYRWRYNPKYDIAVPICAFCTVTPQAAFPGATFLIRTEKIFYNLNGVAEDFDITVIRTDGQTVLGSNTIPGVLLQADDPGRVRVAFTTTTAYPRGLYTMIITGQTTGQQAKAFFYVIEIPGVPVTLT